ncbi:MAG: MoaD/ThiS family protein [Anaerolineae bacterium]|nr:MoaD/ThiS family protein [Anaerolineae bacterium]
MTVTIHAEEMLPARELRLEAATVAEAAARAGLEPRTGLVIMVNGRLAEWMTPLSEGDVVEFLPALGGG